jgi:formylglycine-generating enzyme required for sulfatase activity
VASSAVHPAPSIFVSYSRNDREACIALRAALKAAGFDVFTDEESIQLGERWLTRLEEALNSSCGFVLLVGRDGVQRWVGAEAQVALKHHLSPHDDAQRLPIFPLLLDGADQESLPPFLSLFQAARWSPSQPVPSELLEALRTRRTRFDYQQPFEGCPFLGLNSFSRGDARLFFGRRKETIEALDCLGDQQQSSPERLRASGGNHYSRWLQIEGNSGAGKSSLVSAGILPHIEQGGLWARTGFEHWVLLGPMMPGVNPTAKLAEILEHGLIEDPAQRDSLARLERLQRDERALSFALRDFKQEQVGFLLIVDQFEELFTFSDERPRKAFDALLANALQDPHCPLFLISVVRADFLDRYEQLPRLQVIYNSLCKRYFLPTMSEHSLREVIEQPARLAGLDVRDVTATILNDARDEVGALPLVENALFTLWQQRSDNRLSGELYRQENGIAGMLRAQADALLDRIDSMVPKGRQAALELLLRLTRINTEGQHTRRRITREEAVLVAGAGGSGVGERVVQLLSGERALDIPSTLPSRSLRLITLTSDAGRQYVDLVHETLVRVRGKDALGKAQGYWPTLYDFVEKNQDRDIYREQLKLRTDQWMKSKWFGRLWRLAYFDYFHYRSLRIPADSPEGRFLAWSRWVWCGLMLLAAVLMGFVGDAYYWTRKHDLPLDSMLTLQRFRMGYGALPEMVTVPAGSFDMGEQDKKFVAQLGPDQLPEFGAPGVHVQIGNSFSIGKYEVTYEQFDYYVWSQHRAGRLEIAFPPTEKGGRGQRPVVNVYPIEASGYAKWLGQRTQKNCRLPTEAEWEYAARGGISTETGYPWGNEVGSNHANCRHCGSAWDNKQSAPVGSFAPNAFGLYDTSGNVWEWTCSAWRKTFDGNEQTCAKQQSEDRVVRGGSWGYDPNQARSAYRLLRYPDIRSANIGLRVVCS